MCSNFYNNNGFLHGKQQINVPEDCLGTNCLKLSLAVGFFFPIKFKFPFVSLLSLVGFILLNLRFFFISPVSKAIYFRFSSFPTMTNIVFFWFSGLVKTNEGVWKNNRVSLTNCSIMLSYRFVSVSKEHCQAPRRTCLLALGSCWSSSWPELDPGQAAFSQRVPRPVFRSWRVRTCPYQAVCMQSPISVLSWEVTLSPGGYLGMTNLMG